MKTFLYAFSMLMLLLACTNTIPQELPENNVKHILVIHGGSGTIIRENMTPDEEMAYRAVLTEALQTGYDILKAGKPSLDAVEATIHVLEESPLFNAGKGAVFTHDGRNELDASVMDGKTLMAGAVAGITTVRHPISAARAVMEKSEHVMMVGAGAEAFAAEVGLETVDPEFFWTKRRWDALQKVRSEDSTRMELDHSHQSSKLGIENNDHKFGTVGCVALDNNGNLAAGTSTGGMTNKKYGRVGDSPVIGAGTYANNKTAGISCTGWGEFYMRNVVAYDISAMIEYQGLSVDEASKKAMEKVGDMGGTGGLIALDAKGNVSMPFNTRGMYRGTVTEDGKIDVKIYE